MTTDQYRAAVTELGLTPTSAGPAFGVTARTAQGWWYAERPVPEPIARLLTYMLREFRSRNV